MEYADNTLAIMEAADIRLQEILSGTIPISPSPDIDRKHWPPAPRLPRTDLRPWPYPHQQAGADGCRGSG